MRASLITFAVAGVLSSSCSSKPPCSSPKVDCEGACIDVSSDVTHCGACGKACAAGQVCESGSCKLFCSAGLKQCSGACKDTATDEQNCGQCGNACAAGEVCSGGTCGLTCPQGRINCGGACIDPATSREFCGATGACTGASAGTICTAGQICSGGACTLSCQQGLVSCNGTCIDPLSSRAFCGASGACTGAAAGVACASGEVCSNGTCGVSCQQGLINCGGICVDPATNRTFCGATGACGAAGGGSPGVTCAAGQVCNGGSCELSCGAPLQLCAPAADAGTAPDGGALQPYCARLGGDPTNCGQCGKRCAPGNQCVAGECMRAASYLSPGGLGTTATRFTALEYTIGTPVPATIYFTTDGGTPVPGAPGTQSGPSPLALDAGAGLFVTWFADYGGATGWEPQLHTFNAVTAAPGNDLGSVANKVVFTASNGPMVRVAPGATVTGSVRAQVWRSNASGYCPGCVIEWVLGVDGVGQVACLIQNGTVYPGQTLTQMFSFTAPMTPGRYVMRQGLTLQFTCQAAGYPGGEDVGIVDVQ